MFPPKLIKPYVVSFCRSVVRDPAPRFVPVRARVGAEVMDCFGTVPEQVQEHGGTMVVGWAIWEWPDVLIEAEYHGIWLSATGEEIDVTPKEPPVKRVLFLPDPKRPYEGYQRDSVRKALCRDKDVFRLIELNKLIHTELNRGHLKHQHGAVAVRPEYGDYDREKRAIVQRLHQHYGHKLAGLARSAL